MNKQLKRRIAFALAMGLITTGIVSFALIALNLGFSTEFALIWLRSWAVGYAVAVPAILAIGPRLQAQVDHFIP